MKYLISLLIVFLPLQLFGQDNTLNVIASAGEDQSNANVSVSWTLGAISVDTDVNNNVFLSNGIGQPEIEVISSVNSFSDSRILVFPNPVLNQITIDTEDFSSPMSFELRDITGNRMMQGSILDKEQTLDFSSIPSGIYLLIIENGTFFKIIKP